ncbi:MULTISPECIES: alpha/beta fold hydrolase [unclassified Caballeronia]|uniref:YheT family hydrolase n=1 Tax=unclassified Caballeronia TaxID=2646786 RepID=UPI001FD0069F|nr:MULTISPECIES: alpha/beta fold hydrolase [unclassified Caballeronia]
MKRDPLLKHDSSFVDTGPAAALKESVQAAGRTLGAPVADWLYNAPRWLPTSHAQTIVPALFGRKPAVQYRRERWTTPDGDFIDLDWVADEAPADAPLFVLFHGLEGSSDSHYARTMMAAAQARGWHGVVPHFRTCSGALNLLPRFYHLADSAEVDWILRRLRANHAGPIVAAGVSLGGNVLLHWLCDRGAEASSIISAAAAISAPLDVHAGGAAISQGFGMIYTRSFLKSLKRKALAKLGQFPGLYDRDAVLAARTLYEFDNVVTAPLHGFRDTNHYWSTATTRAHLNRIAAPALILNARNDPFLPEFALPSQAEVSSRVTLDQPNHGGHVGFMTGPFPGRIDWLSQRVFGYLENFVAHG